MIALVNDMAGADDKDIENFSAFLAAEVPSATATIEAANKLPGKSRIATLRHVVVKVIDALIQQSEETTKHYTTAPAPALSNEQKVDLALQKTRQAIGHISDEKWEEDARTAGMPTDEFRTDTWSRLYYGFLEELS
jgi:hypothetical protein